ncbi:hypothetical protein KR009_000509 [Drosophila setifemur]|nr:hypothetical protein KR009_000509 [Drosophila setifemur]
MFFKCFFLLSAVNVLSAGRVPQPENRIIGGYDTEIEIVPWQVVILRNGEFLCGGSIYDTYFIITAAHCIINAKEKELTVRAGSSWSNQGGTLVKVDKMRYNRWFNSNNYDNDIAVLRLSEPLKLSEKIQPIPLATKNPTTRSVALMSGYGTTKIVVDREMYDREYTQLEMDLLNANPSEHNKIMSDFLINMINAGIIEVTSTGKLQSSYDNIIAPHECNPNLNQSKICAGSVNKTTCRGDSGGPLVVSGKLVGVTSAGPLLCDGHSTFTSIPYFHCWIRISIMLLSCQ